MSLKPVDWSVVIIGRWNPAILTPGGIAKFVFNIQEPDPKRLEIAVPLDGVSPYQVKHPEENIVVLTDANRLLIRLTQMDYDSLGQALGAGIHALGSLPVTPVSAAGFNVSFHTSDCQAIMDMVNADVDNILSDLDYQIAARTITRTIKYNDGVINITATGKSDGQELVFNFHRASTSHEELIKWFEATPVAIEGQVKGILEKLNLEVEEQVDESDGDAE